MEKPNRAERRKNKFGGGRATEHGGWPTVQPNPVLGAVAPSVFGADDSDATETPKAEATEADATEAPKADKATAGRPDQDQTSATGPGTGGATEQAGRAPRHDGTHAGNSTKG